ncbi:hypothetical protein M0R45_028033 [Rubus argutus]|uniref:KIB1-4 beta-propeller domain-containing protein n=1 Tax=Rubus argutus TaxID=59490 RepID=A0AAW1W3D6_RUBAR
MKVVALVSGGKDSCYAMMKCIQYGHQESEEKSTNLAPSSFFITWFWLEILDFCNTRDGKDLLMVERCCNWEDLDNLQRRFASEFKVFRFNFDKGEWIEKKTLGDDVAVFIGENLSVSVVASNFPGCKRNCIFYNHDFDFMNWNDELHDCGVYDMETKSISKPYSEHVMTLLGMTNQSPIWFTPTFQL